MGRAVLLGRVDCPRPLRLMSAAVRKEITAACHFEHVLGRTDTRNGVEARVEGTSDDTFATHRGNDRRGRDGGAENRYRSRKTTGEPGPPPPGGAVCNSL